MPLMMLLQQLEILETVGCTVSFCKGKLFPTNCPNPNLSVLTLFKNLKMRDKQR